MIKNSLPSATFFIRYSVFQHIKNHFLSKVYLNIGYLQVDYHDANTPHRWQSILATDQAVLVFNRSLYSPHVALKSTKIWNFQTILGNIQPLSAIAINHPLRRWLTGRLERQYSNKNVNYNRNVFASIIYSYLYSSRRLTEQKNGNNLIDRSFRFHRCRIINDSINTIEFELTWTNFINKQILSMSKRYHFLQLLSPPPSPLFNKK